MCRSSSLVFLKIILVTLAFSFSENQLANFYQNLASILIKRALDVSPVSALTWISFWPFFSLCLLGSVFPMKASGTAPAVAGPFPSSVAVSGGSTPTTEGAATPPPGLSVLTSKLFFCWAYLNAGGARSLLLPCSHPWFLEGGQG